MANSGGSLKGLLGQTQSKLFQRIGEHLEELQVTIDDLLDISLSEVIEDADFDAMGLNGDVKRRWVLRKLQRLVTTQEVGNSKYIKHALEKTGKDGIYHRIGCHLSELQVDIEDIESADDIKQFFTSADLENIGLASVTKQKLVMRKAAVMLVELRDTLPDLIEELNNPEPLFDSSPSSLTPAFLTKHHRKESRKFTLSGPVDASAYWRFYFGMQKKVTVEQMEGAIESILQSASDDKRRTDDGSVKTVLLALVGGKNVQSVMKQDFYALMDSLNPNDVAKSFMLLQDEYSKLQQIEQSKSFKSVTMENCEEYIGYAIKYQGLVRKKNFVRKLWLYLITHFYLSSLPRFVELTNKFSSEYGDDTGKEILEKEVFGNATRIGAFLTSPKSCFLNLSEKDLIAFLNEPLLAANEEALFEHVVEWAKVNFDKEKQRSAEGEGDGKYPYATWEQRLQPLLRFIRFPVMSDPFIVKNVVPMRDLFRDDQLFWVLVFRLSMENEFFADNTGFNCQRRANAPQAMKTPRESGARLAKVQSENIQLKRKLKRLQKQVSDLKKRMASSGDVDRVPSSSSRDEIPLSLTALSKESDAACREPDEYLFHTRDISYSEEPSVSVKINEPDSSLFAETEPGGRRRDSVEEDVKSDSGGSDSGIRTDHDHDDPKRIGARICCEEPSSATAEVIETPGEPRVESADVTPRTPEPDTPPPLRQGEASIDPDKFEALAEQVRAEQAAQVFQEQDEEFEEDDEEALHAETERRRKEAAEKMQRTHKFSIASEMVDGIVEGDKGGAFLLKFSRLEGMNAREEEEAKQKFEEMQQRMLERQALSRQKSRDSISAGSKPKRKKKKKHLIPVGDLERPLYPDEPNIAEVAWTRLEKLRILDYQIKPGVKVKLAHSDRTAIVRYVGEATFVWGMVIGLELQKAWTGKHDGDFEGVKYFSCKKKSKGLFVKPHTIEHVFTKDSKSDKGNRSARSQSMFGKTRAGTLVGGSRMNPKKPEDYTGKFANKTELARVCRLALEIGDCVKLNKGERAIIHYMGPTKGSRGLCVFGLELLDGALGTTNGSENGVQYFRCEERRGVFVSSDKIRKKVDYVSEHYEW